jgi:hypothetical protein
MTAEAMEKVSPVTEVFLYVDCELFWRCCITLRIVGFVFTLTFFRHSEERNVSETGCISFLR